MSEYILETITHKQHTIEILPDEDAENPRNDENVGTMICFHSRYTLGDKHNYTDADDLHSRLSADFGDSPIVLPLYLYDHGGITMRCSSFSCSWDSGQVGYIVCSRKKAIYEWGKNRFTKAIQKKAVSYMQSEVSSYDLYLTGGYVGFRIKDKSDTIIDSCWGFDDQSYAIKEAKSIIDYTVKSAWEKRQKLLKSFIKNHVPLYARSF
jgi:hypothetical protein